MSKTILIILAKALIQALKDYAKTTEGDLDDKAVSLIESVLKHFSLV